MGNSSHVFLFFIFILIITLLAPLSAYAREYPEIESVVTDIPDVLTDSQEKELVRLLDDLKAFNKIRGLIVIAKDTGAWDILEYRHDLFDHARSIGMTDETGFLIYISVDDKKLTVTAGDTLLRVTDENELREIRNKAGEYLESADYFNAFEYAISRFRNLTGPEELDKARDTRSDFLMLAGLTILVVVLLHNVAKRRRTLKETPD